MAAVDGEGCLFKLRGIFLNNWLLVISIRKEFYRNYDRFNRFIPSLDMIDFVGFMLVPFCLRIENWFLPLGLKVRAGCGMPPAVMCAGGAG